MYPRIVPSPAIWGTLREIFAAIRAAQWIRNLRAIDRLPQGVELEGIG
jgi:hypothetical protein